MELELRQLFRVVRRWWWLLLLLPILTGLTTNRIAARQQPLYSAETLLQVNLAPGTTGSADYNSLLFAQNLASTYQQLISTRSVLTSVITKLHLPYTVDELRSRVTAATVHDTMLLSVKVSDTDPARAAAIANAVATEFAAHVKQQPVQEGAAAQITLADPAVPPTSPYAPRTKLYTLLSLFIGLLLALGVAFLLEYLDNTVKATSDFAELTGAPLLATVGAIPKLQAGHGQLFVLEQPKLGSTEAIRLLRTNLEFAAASQEITTLAVSSPGLGEGKSTLTANLGVAMAQAGFSTVIVDADLRRPSQHRIFGVPNQRGLTSLLTHPQQAWRWAAAEVMPGLALVPSGPLPPNPADLLSLDRLRALLTELASSVDLILIDTPPLLAVSDPLVIATNVDGVMLVCRAGQTRLDALRRAAASLQQGAVRIVGTVVNQQSGRGADGYYYYTGYYQADDTAPRGPSSSTPSSAAPAPVQQAPPS